MLYKSIDLFPHDYDKLSLNHATSLDLPLNAVIYHASKFASMTVANVFQLHSSLQSLHWKDVSDPSLTAWNRTPKHIYKGIESGDLLLQPFFRPPCAPAGVDTT